jgi:hypothetical protein
MRYLKKLLFPIGLPLFLAFVLSDKTFLNFLGMLIGSSFIWIPCLLAWWLSDGFKNISLSEDAEEVFPIVSSSINPSTGESCTTIQYRWGKVYC